MILLIGNLSFMIDNNGLTASLGHKIMVSRIVFLVTNGLISLLFLLQLSLQCTVLQKEMWRSRGAKKLFEKTKTNNLRGCHPFLRIPSARKRHPATLIYCKPQALVY